MRKEKWFCKLGSDNIKHFEECKNVGGWFAELGRNKEKKLAYIYKDNLGERESFAKIIEGGK